MVVCWQPESRNLSLSGLSYDSIFQQVRLGSSWGRIDPTPSGVGRPAVHGVSLPAGHLRLAVNTLVLDGQDLSSPRLKCPRPAETEVFEAAKN